MERDEEGRGKGGDLSATYRDFSSYEADMPVRGLEVVHD